MAIEIRETFAVQAPIGAVWRFVMDPHQVVTCMPGAELEEVVDDHTFVGRVKVKVGAITTSYKGRVRLTQVDEQQYTVVMVAEGREPGGGTAKGSMTSRLRALEGDCTEVVAEASVDLTGRIMQVGRGMVQGVAHQLFRQFAARVQERLEVPGAGGPAPAAENEPIRALPLVLRALWSMALEFWRRLLGRPRG